MTYPTAPLGVRIRTAIGIFDPSTDPSTWPWTDLTLDVDHLVPIEDSIGAPDDVSEPSTTLSFALKNDISRIAPTVTGRYTTDNPESDLWPFFDVGTPIEYALDVGDGGGWDVQCITFIQTAENDWPSNTQYKAVARISCVGEMQRGGVLTQTQQSPMYRTIMDRKNLGFWPFEDASGATAGGSALAFQPPMTRYGGLDPFDFGQSALVPGVSAGVKISTGQGMWSLLNRRGLSGGLRLGFMLYAESNPAGYSELVCWQTTTRKFILDLGPSALRIRVLDATGAEIFQQAAGFTDHLDAPVFCEIEAYNNGSTMNWAIRETTWTIGPDGQPSAKNGSASGTGLSGQHGAVTFIGVATVGNLNDVQLSVLAATELPFPGAGGFAAVIGWAGNTAAGRVAGMCDEAGIPRSVTNTTYGAVMGPQLIDTLRANMIDCMTTDHGVLTDHLGKVAYRSLQELYNLTPAITLTRSVRGQLGELNPVRDDTAKTNRVTVSRRDGGSFTAEDAQDILVKGLYATSAPSDLNLALDSALPSHAGWFLARGVASGYRYDQLVMKMRTAAEYTPALAGQVAALQLGDRIAISNLPPQAAKGGIERIVRGRSQTVLNRGMKQWDVTYQMVPTEAYQAFILDTDRLDTAGTEVILAASSTATTLMTATAGPLPATGAGQSIDLYAAGEQVLLTAVATETISDPFTRTVSNGWGSIPATSHLPAYPYVVTSTASDYAATGSAATMLLSSGGSFRSAHIPALVMINVDMTIFVTIPALATGANIEAQLGYRWNGSLGNGYSARLCCEPGGTTHLYLFTPNNDAIVDIPLTLTHTAGATYGIRVAPIGTLHRVRVWQGTSSANEPSAWSAEVQDSTRFTGGYSVVRGGRAVGNTNASLTLTWDNLTVNNVQAFTVTRSQGGGVVKAQAVGNQVKLWRGKGLGI
jgi:hypothetical protein